MIKTIILALVIGFILFELIENVVFPLFWFIKGRKRKSFSGASDMLGPATIPSTWAASPRL
jgi:hypothetical protein